jgi:hypothetical protein
MKPRLEIGCLVLLIVLFIGGGIALNYYIQKARHPNAPTWTLFFK